MTSDITKCWFSRLAAEVGSFRGVTYKPLCETFHLEVQTGFSWYAHGESDCLFVDESNKELDGGLADEVGPAVPQ